MRQVDIIVQNYANKRAYTAVLVSLLLKSLKQKEPYASIISSASVAVRRPPSMYSAAQIGSANEQQTNYMIPPQFLYIDVV